MANNDYGWPATPGVPLNPERDGYHAVACATGDADGVMMLYWVPAEQWTDNADVVGGWTLDPLRENAHIFTDFEDEGYRRVHYLGPCLLPSEVAAREAAARRAGIEAAADVAAALMRATRDAAAEDEERLGADYAGMDLFDEGYLKAGERIEQNIRAPLAEMEARTDG
jgi:hypothetical protein